MFGHGRGLAELKTTAEHLETVVRVVSHFSNTRYNFKVMFFIANFIFIFMNILNKAILRFTSSAIEVLDKLYVAFEGYVSAYETFRRTNDECDEMPYKIKGQFVASEISQIRTLQSKNALREYF